MALKAKAKLNQNQWGEFAVQNISKSSYGYSLSTVFGVTEKRGYHQYDEEDDPLLTNIRFLDYRYVRLYFHPLKDRFILCTNWKDPNWTDVKSVRVGLESDERHRREQVFGKNEIDIEQKSIPQLLIDEVRGDLMSISCSSLKRFRLSTLSMFSRSPVSSSGR